MKRNFKVLMAGGLLAFLISLSIMISEDFANIFLSFVDVSGTKSSAEGSSILMRVNQFLAVFDTIKGNEFFGNGFNWTTYYTSKFGNHPKLIAFESLIFVVLCNNGLYGLIIWTIFIYQLFKIPRKLGIAKEDLLYVDVLLITFFAYSIGTGLYDFMNYFIIYYTVMIGFMYKKTVIDIYNKQQNLSLHS